MTRRHRTTRSRLKGAAAIETALSMMILALVLSAGIEMGHAMVVRHRLLEATTRASRVCSLFEAAAADQCVNAQVRAALGNVVESCARLQIDPQVGDIAGVEVLRAEVECQYGGGPWSGMVRRFAPDVQMTLRAQAVMPTR